MMIEYTNGVDKITTAKCKGVDGKPLLRVHKNNVYICDVSENLIEKLIKYHLGVYWQEKDLV